MKALEQTSIDILGSHILPRIISIKELLVNKNLTIPIYQRPYKWNVQHVSQMIADIKVFCNKPIYRFGTIVVHKDKLKPEINIVDGQQRTITLLLVIKAIIEKYKYKEEESEVKNEILALESELVNFRFSNPLSQQNVYKNYKEIKRLVSDFDDDLVMFLLNRCEVIQFQLQDVSEAFQFFDSQNARGKDLDPHDLLKAFHLRVFDESDQKDKFRIVDDWENTEDDKLANLFSQYLFRIKGWTKGLSSRNFSKDEIHLFKGVNIAELNNYPYSNTLRILHYFIDDYNSSYHRKVDQTYFDYPFQLDQTIINGRRFFEMIKHYHQVFSDAIKNIQLNKDLNKQSTDIINLLNNYDGRARTGDLYTRLLFDTILTFYVDKFGFNSINAAVQYFFAWAYNLRLSYQNLQFSSVDNYVLANNMFQQIRDAYIPKQVFITPIIVIEVPKSSKTASIKNLLTELNF